MRPHRKIDPHLGKEALLKTSAVIAGQNEPIYQDPFALSRIISKREMLEHIILPSQGLSFEDFPNMKKAFETGIRISSHKAVTQTSEATKLNLAISGRLEGEDYSNRPPIFQIYPNKPQTRHKTHD